MYELMILRRIVFLTFFLISFNYAGRLYAQGEILVFAGSASKPAVEEVAKVFYKKTGIKVNINFGGSGYMLTQMLLAKKGDIYFPGSSDFMEKAKKLDAVFPETEKIVVYLVPAIVVQKGNPKSISSLKDLLKPGLKTILANPKEVCLGLYSVEIIEKNLDKEEINTFRKNIANYTESCEKTSTAITLKMADATIGWRVFKYWAPKDIDIVTLKDDEIHRIGYIPIAISKFAKNKALAHKFIDFITSYEAKQIFKKHSYFTTPEDAYKFIGKKVPIGGEYNLPQEWVLQ